MSYVELKNITVKSRKKHSCEWCAEAIDIGENCIYRVYIFDGNFMHGRMHGECQTAMLSVSNDDLVSGWAPGDYKRGSAEGN